MSVYRPPLGRGRGRARQRDTYSPGAEPSRPDKDGLNASDRWGHDLYDERDKDRWDHDDRYDRIDTDKPFRGGTNKDLSTYTDKRQENKSCSTPTSRMAKSGEPKSQPRSERTRGRGKRPDMQVYVPRGRRSQDALKTSTDKTSSKSPSSRLASSSNSLESQTPQSSSHSALQLDHKGCPSPSSSYINNESHTPVRANKKRKVLDRRKETMEDNDGMAVISHHDNQPNVKERFLDNKPATLCSESKNGMLLEHPSCHDNEGLVNPRTTSHRVNEDLGLTVDISSRKDSSPNANSLDDTSLETNGTSNTNKKVNDLQTMCRERAESDNIQDELRMVCGNDIIDVPEDTSAIIDTCDIDNSVCINRTAVMDIPSTSDLIVTDSAGNLAETQSIHEESVSVCEKTKSSLCDIDVQENTPKSGYKLSEEVVSPSKEISDMKTGKQGCSVQQSDLSSMDISSNCEIKPEALSQSNLIPSSDEVNQQFPVRKRMNDTEDIAVLHEDRHHNIADKSCHLMTDANTVPEEHEMIEGNSTKVDVISTVSGINDEGDDMPVIGGCDPSINPDEIMPFNNHIKSLDNDTSCENVGLCEPTANPVDDPTGNRMETESEVVDMEKSNGKESIVASEDKCINPQAHQTVSIAETIQADDGKSMIDSVADKTNTDVTVQGENDEAIKQENNIDQSKKDETFRCDSAEEGHLEINKPGEVDYNKASQCVNNETIQGENNELVQGEKDDICQNETDQTLRRDTNETVQGDIKETIQRESNEKVQRDTYETVQGGNDEAIQSENNETCDGDNEDEEDDDTWDSMFNEDGDCLDPSVMEELTQKVGKVKIQKSKKINYLDYKPKDKGEVEYTEYGHIIEIYDFPAEFATRDLISAFHAFLSRGFDLKWVDDTHALGIFSSSIAAQDAAGLIHPLIKVRPLSQASQQSRTKARRCSEFLKPYKPRPETSASAARRLVAGALGLATNVSKEKRERERQQLKEAKEKRKKDRKNREDIWEYGKCAMDEET